jgi:hypothetical protein
MRSSERWLASALMAALVLVGTVGAQLPDQKAEPPRGLVPSARVSVGDIVERILAFDKNKDGKVAKDELPERMHDLIARGDTNKDGALDQDEIKKLASTPRGFGFGGFRGVAFDIVGGAIGGAVDDLKLSGQKKDQALAVVKAHQENVRTLTDQARAEMLLKMKEVLSEEEFKDFKAALDRQSAFGERGVIFNFNLGPAGAPRPGEPRLELGPAGPPRPGELEQRLEQLQKELEELRRQLRR